MGGFVFLTLITLYPNHLSGGGGGGGGVVVEQVETFTYLVNVIDNHLSITQWANYLFKKAQQRLSLLRRLKSFNVDSTH